MTLRREGIEIVGKPPVIPSSMPVFKVTAASLDDRKNAIEILQSEFNLGQVVTVEMQESLHFISKRGEVQYYRPSGSIWARNVAADDGYKDELRPWKTKKVRDEEDSDAVKLILYEDLEKELVSKTRSIFKETNLLGTQSYLADVTLEQITQLDENGKALDLFAGEATVRFLYRLENRNVDGAGAKSYTYFYPNHETAEIVGLFHTWRDVTDTVAVKTMKVEEIIDTIIVKDKEVALYIERGHKIKLTKLDLVYYSLPPFMYQEYVFPVLRVIGSVYRDATRSSKQGFEFARYFHALSAEEYRNAGLFADYLTTIL